MYVFFWGAWDLCSVSLFILFQPKFKNRGKLYLSQITKPLQIAVLLYFFITAHENWPGQPHKTRVSKFNLQEQQPLPFFYDNCMSSLFSLHAIKFRLEPDSPQRPFEIMYNWFAARCSGFSNSRWYHNGPEHQTPAPNWFATLSSIPRQPLNLPQANSCSNVFETDNMVTMTPCLVRMSFLQTDSQAGYAPFQSFGWELLIILGNPANDLESLLVETLFQGLR